MVDASIKAEAQALRNKGFAWAKIALSLGVNERTVYKWRERGEVSDPAAPPPEVGPPMSPAEIVTSLWATLSRAARSLAASDQVGGQAHSRTLKLVSDTLDRLLLLKGHIAAAETAAAEEAPLDEFREDLARRIEALHAATPIEERIDALRAALAKAEAEVAGVVETLADTLVDVRPETAPEGRADRVRDDLC